MYIDRFNVINIIVKRGELDTVSGENKFTSYYIQWYCSLYVIKELFN